MYVFTDILRRTLEYKGLQVKQVINFTDFGHLSGDNQGQADEGEDRMTKGLKREGLELTLANMKNLAEKLTRQ
jgi:cysteinyl-tRNA synthetase